MPAGVTITALAAMATVGFAGETKRSAQRAEDAIDDFFDEAVETFREFEIKNIIKKIPQEYKENFRCEEFASELESLMKKKGISGEKITIQSSTDFIWSDTYGTISTNGRHYGIKIGDKLYDNLNPQGINYSDWLQDLGVKDFPDLFEITNTLIR